MNPEGPRKARSALQDFPNSLSDDYAKIQRKCGCPGFADVGGDATANAKAAKRSFRVGRPWNHGRVDPPAARMVSAIPHPAETRMRAPGDGAPSRLDLDPFCDIHVSFGPRARNRQ